MLVFAGSLKEGRSMVNRLECSAFAFAGAGSGSVAWSLAWRRTLETWLAGGRVLVVADSVVAFVGVLAVGWRFGVWQSWEHFAVDAAVECSAELDSSAG